VVIVQVKGIKFRALLDSGASNSFVSETLVSLVGVKAVKTSTRQISTLMGATATKMSQFDLSLQELKGGFVLNARAAMIKNRELLLLDNPHLDKRIEAHQYLRDIEFED
jgi:ABC-type molybdenum transport system ATPase subunit/photorepair protein PhrA